MSGIDEITRVDSLADWNSGPDTLQPSDSYFSCKLDQPVLLRSKDVDKVKYPIYSIYTCMKTTVNKIPDHVALAYKVNNVWVHFTYDEYWKICNKAAKSFIKVFFTI